MADGGSITLRLAVAGSAEVKAALASLGPVGAAALRQIEEAAHAPTAGMRALDAAGEKFTERLKELGNGTGAFGSALMAVGPAGLAAAAGIGAMIEVGREVAERTIETAEWAEEVQKFSDRTGVATKTVQQWDFVMQGLGVGVDKAAPASKGLTQLMGQIEDGLTRGKNPRSVRLMEQILGTSNDEDTRAQLRTLGDVTNLLPKIQAFVQGMPATQRAGIASVLKIDPEVLTALAEGKSDIDALTEAARRYGIIVDEDLIKKGAAAAGQLRVTKTVIDDELRVAFLRLTPVMIAGANGLLSVSQQVANLAKSIADNWDWLSKLIQVFGLAANPLGSIKGIIGLNAGPSGDLSLRSDASLRAQQQQLLSRNAELIHENGNDVRRPGDRPREAMSGAQREYQQNLAAYVALGTELNRRQQPAAAPEKDGNGWAGLPPAAGKAHAEKGPTDQEVQDRLTSLQDQASNDVLTATKRTLSAELAMATSAEDKARIQTQINALDDAAEAAAAKRRDDQAAAEIDKIKNTKGASAAQKKAADTTLKSVQSEEIVAELLDDEARQERDRKDLRDEAKAKTDAANRLSDIGAQNQLDLLKAEVALTTAMAARRDLELKIFDLEEAQRELEQRRIISDTHSTAQQVAEATATLAGLQNTAGTRRQAVSNQYSANPWDAMLQKMSTEVAPINQEFGQIASDGLQRFNQGLFDAQGRLNSLQDIARSVFQQMIVALEQYLVRQGEIGLLGNGTASGGFLGGLGNIFGLPGGATAAESGFGTVAGLFASGGPIYGRGTAKSDSIWARLSNGEYVFSADAVSRWGLPTLDAMNGGRGPIPHFAGGGAVGAGGAGAPGSANTYHDNRDFSVHGVADTTALQTLARQQQDFAKNEPARWVAYAKAANKK